MDARVSHADEAFPYYAPESADGDFLPNAFYAGDPVCARGCKGVEAVPYSYLVLLLLLTVGCAFAADDMTRQAWVSKVEALANSFAAPKQPLAAPELPPPNSMASNAAVSPNPPPPPAPAAATVEQPLPVVTVSNAPGDSDAGASGKKGISDAYAPPAPSSDPYRKKAEAVGLHPDLSRAVLARLTPADYRNAAYAIEKAIKTVPDDAEFTWPRARKTGAAVFNVHFVQGGGRDCRRYVVTVTKDRWTSTALPMEKCGVKIAVRKPGAEKAIE